MKNLEFLDYCEIKPLSTGAPVLISLELLYSTILLHRYGFNSDGHDVVLGRLEKLRKEQFNGVIGVNLGKNKTSPDAINDYVDGIKKFGAVADYLVINISR